MVCEALKSAILFALQRFSQTDYVLISFNPKTINCQGTGRHHNYVGRPSWFELSEPGVLLVMRGLMEASLCKLPPFDKPLSARNIVI